MKGLQSYFSSIYSFINTLLFFHFHLHFVKEFLNVLLSFVLSFLTLPFRFNTFLFQLNFLFTIINLVAKAKCLISLNYH